MNLTFTYADKQCMSEWIPDTFKILRDNMNRILPTGNDFETDASFYMTHAAPALCTPEKCMILIHDGNLLVGYLQYTLRGKVLFLEDLQIQEAYQGKGILRLLFAWLTPQLPGHLECVELLCAQNNVRARAIYEHLGMKIIGMNKNGVSYHYQIPYEAFAHHYGASLKTL